jgi:hypothetical protein
MADTTYEQVRRCPRCDVPAESVPGGRLQGAVRGSSSLRFTCRNDRCRWNNSSWIVQVRPDGTFPPALTKRDKIFPKLPTPSPELADSLETLEVLTTQPGAEIRR